MAKIRFWKKSVLASFCLFSSIFLSLNALAALPVWIDTDPAVGVKDRDVDDGFALVMAFQSPEIQVHGVSVVFGNTELDPAFEIGRKFVQQWSPKTPIYRGAKSDQDRGIENSATKALFQELKKQPLTILALGPLTNIATVIENHPEIQSKIRQVVVVAGRRPEQRFVTGVKNFRSHRDFNFEKDPKAMEVLLKSSIAVTLTGFEVSSQVWLTQEDLVFLKRSHGESELLLASQQWLSLWGKLFDVSGFNPFDTLAVGFLTHPQLYSCETVPTGIAYDHSDQTEPALQGGGISIKPYLWSLLSQDISKKEDIFQKKTKKPIRDLNYCYSVDPSFKKILLERLSKKPSSK